jgi:hypothetical protein
MKFEPGLVFVFPRKRQGESMRSALGAATDNLGHRMDTRRQEGQEYKAVRMALGSGVVPTILALAVKTDLEDS